MNLLLNISDLEQLWYISYSYPLTVKFSLSIFLSCILPSAAAKFSLECAQLSWIFPFMFILNL